ncbi:GtrA family protein [Curtobacterium sp. MCJR17_043]|uniref:GtrA family protein n=1 Tax=Curtobacterium sp. MCJR17_043 TaxID=2175660 RepID=UPI0024DF4C49|nr:GtrA family protein [Curtobacterium sp. MCJR17_043]WIB36768.1 GtrA family protein [Curtobacterium sp. MCJR17_043]
MAAAAASRLVRLTRAVRELATFGAVGLIAFVVDLVVFNVLRAGVLADHAVTAKAVSVVVATLVAWLGNRFVTFRTQRTRGRREAVREGVLFAATNAGGLAIAAGCLLVSHHVLGLTSTLADNVAGNGVGLVLGTAFRFAAYKTLVFRSPRRSSHEGAHRMTMLTTLTAAAAPLLQPNDPAGTPGGRPEPRHHGRPDRRVGAERARRLVPGGSGSATRRSSRSPCC